MSTLTSRRLAGRRFAAVLTVGAVAVLAIAPATLAAGPQVVTFASGTDWTVTDEDGSIGPSLSLPGAAQNVCLNASAPTPCPAGATEYGWPGGGWVSDLSSIPGATWIWAPGITKDTTPADDDRYRFAKTVNVPGTPISGSVSVAVDDGAWVWVNGTEVGSTGNPSGLAVFDIGPELKKGNNTIVVIAANGPICGRVCTYQENPGGVVFGGSISYAPAATSRPSVSTPPTSTIDPAAPSQYGPGLGLVLLGVAAVIAASAHVSRRAGRRQR
jgi:hypothetical protein